MIKRFFQNIVSRLPYIAQKNIYLSWYLIKNIKHVLKKPIVPKKEIDIKKEKVHLVGFLKIHNEEKNGNLERVLQNMKRFCDDIVVCDCDSDDNSIEIAKKFTRHIIKASNDFEREIFTKQIMLEYTLKLNPTWIIWLDADEVVDRDGELGDIRRLCIYGDKHGIDGFEFLEYNLWKNKTHYRVDEFWHKGWYVRLWKNNGNLKFETKEGLHLAQYPSGLKKIRKAATKVIHFGFVSKELISEKYERYKSHGQSGYMKLERFYNEDGLRLKPMEINWFPKMAIPRDKFTNSIDGTVENLDDK